MTWFRHHYYCEGCDGTWLGEMELVIESDCPFCGARDMVPYKSDDRTCIVEQRGDKFVVLECRKSAASGPDYLVRGRFSSRATAEAFVAANSKAA
jgi:hypothetical protein